MSKTPLAVVVLAAGQGTRMKSSLPKVLHTLAGKPMINWILETLEGLSPDRIITVIGPDMPALERAVHPHTTIIQEDRNGTGGAVRCALPALEGFKGDVLIVLGDAPLLRQETLENLIAARHSDLLTGLSVLGMSVDNPKGYGRLIMDKQKIVTHIVEEKDASAKERRLKIVNAGAFCIDSQRLSDWLEKLDNTNAQGEYYLTDLPKIAAQDDSLCQLSLCDDPDELRGCNTRRDLAALERTLQGRLRQKHMDQGVTLLDPQSVYFHHDTAVAQDCVIEPSVFFGAGVRVEKNVVIKAFSHIEGADIQAGASIGPFARLRPDTVIGEDVRIGNFVEIKESTIQARSKIGHLAYVGDASMGEDVNFSAGAITVNYDGFQKHKTQIGKGVMIGSNVNLVAPLSIDDGAFVAAGSTITEDVPADALSIARDVVEIRKGWAAKYRKLKQAAKKRRNKS